ncbi:hypothetical protein V6N13_124558 [Hibiscus sabdariffa]
MGPGNNPVPSSPSSSSSEANGKAIPQVYKGHGKKERVDSLSFFGSKSNGADGIKIWTLKAIDKATLPPTKIEQDEHVCLVLKCVHSTGI